jgi:sugar lactone lactonase YvrE
MKRLLFLLLMLPVFADGQVITTYAGNGYGLGSGYGGYSGDSGYAVAAELNNPVGVAVDRIGNVYIADRDNNRIRKVDPSGIITTFAGNGDIGFSGDGGPAKYAQINTPEGLFTDSIGNLYISDAGNSRIRKVNTSGIITTIAGNGTYGYSGDGGPADSAELRAPAGIALDRSGNLYIADFPSMVVRKVNSSGVITTFAGTGTYGFSGDGGAATSAELYGPTSVVVDRTGNVYIADDNNYRVRIVNNSGIIATFAGGGTGGDGGLANDAWLLGAAGLAIDSTGNIYIAGGDRIRVVNSLGIIYTYAGNGIQGYSGDGGVPDSAELHGAQSVAVDSIGNVFIADVGNQRIRRVGAGTAGIGQLETTQSISFFPNPTTTQLTISSSDNITSIFITNLLGQMVYCSQLAVGSMQASVDVAGLPSGVYFVKVNGVDVRKFVKE